MSHLSNLCLFHHKPKAGELHGQESKKTTWADTLDSPGPAHYEETADGLGVDGFVRMAYHP